MKILWFVVGMFATLTVNVPLGRSLRDVLGRDLAQRKAIGQVVVKGRALDLGADGEERASRYAAVARVSMPFQLVQQLFLFTALFAQRAVAIIGGDDPFPGFSVGFVICFGALLVVLVPWSLRNLARVRRYGDAHPVREAVTA